MAYVRDPKLIIDKMKSENIKYYTVFDSDGKSVIDQQDDENCTSTEAQDRLQDLLFNLEGLVTVVLRTTSKKTRSAGGDLSTGTFKFSIRCSDGVKSIGSTGGNGLTGLSEILKLQAEKHQLEMQALKNQFDMMNQMSELRREMKEAQEGDNTDKWLPILQQFISNPQMTKAAPKVALAGTEEPKPSDDRKAILQDAISRLYKVDPDLHNNLAKLAAFAEENPNKYSMYLNML